MKEGAMVSDTEMEGVARSEADSARETDIREDREGKG